MITVKRATSSRRPATIFAAITQERVYAFGVVVALLLGWGLRVVFWWQQGRVLAIQPLSDEEEYYRGAIQLLKSLSYYDGGQWLRAPMPSVVLAVCLLLSGGIHLPRALFLQSLISGLVVLPVAATARSLWNSRRAGWVAGLFAALYVPFALSAGQLMSEPIALPLIAMCMWCLERWRTGDRPRWLFWAGVTLAAFSLTRAVGLYAQLLVIGWVWWRAPKKRAAVPLIGIFLLGFWLLLAPWSIRNTLTYGQIVLVDTNAGFSFWSGTDDPADKVAIQVAANRDYTNSAERQAYYMDRAVANVVRDPAAWVLAMRSKIVAFWQPRVRVLIANGLYSLVPAQNSVPITLLGDLLYLVVAVGTIVALIYVARSRQHWFLWAWPLYGTALAAVSLGHPRLRLPFEISLLILGAYPIAHPHQVWQELRQRSLRRHLLFAGMLGGAALLLFSSAYIPFARSEARLAQAWLWQALGDQQRSRAATEAAVQAAPDSALPLLILARQQAARGDQQAVATWQNVVRLDPAIVEAQAQLLRVALQTNDTPAIEERISTLRALRRDDNRLYAWLWEHNTRQPQPDLQIGTSADLGLIQGVSEPRQLAGVPFRWLEERAAIRLPAGGAITLRLELRGRRATAAQIFAADQRLGSCDVALEWRTCSVELPASAASRTIIVQSPVDVAWPPDDYLPHGAALARVWIAP